MLTPNYNKLMKPEILIRHPMRHTKLCYVINQLLGCKKFI